MRDRRSRFEILYGNSRQVGKINRRIVFTALLGTCVAVLLILMFVGYFGSKGKEAGVIVLPEREIAFSEPVSFLQNDPRWAKDRLGTARDTMAASGCLVTAMASGLDMQAREEGKDFYITPGELNQALSAAGAYTDGGAVIWEKVQAALPETDIYVTDSVSAEKINQVLSEGRYPLVKVRMGGNGAYHWVLLVGADREHYYCMDPLTDSEEALSLAAFADRVYSMRAVFLTDN